MLFVGWTVIAFMVISMVIVSMIIEWGPWQAVWLAVILICCFINLIVAASFITKGGTHERTRTKE